ncbi:MAG: YqaA family protein [Nitrosomonadales bacterium]|jgi:membrane protein YqaA with SNARE-associated domain
MNQKNFFLSFYQKTINLSKHKNAPLFLLLVSFSESSFFLVPPDVLLAPMCLANRKKSFHFATLTTIASVLGGLFGYLIGYFAFNLIEPYVMSHYGDAYQTTIQWFETYGFWAILIAGFTPIPYKIFTIAGGVAHMAIVPFIAGSLIGRGSRFFLLASLIYFFGNKIDALIKKIIDRISWLILIIVSIYLCIRFFN